MEPKDAATLIILRDHREVLLGVRSAAHAFMPHKYVFPGGRLDPEDEIAPRPIGLRREVESRLTASVSSARAHGLAMAAVRETFEETGLVLGAPSPPSLAVPASWAPFFATGLAPALDRVEYVARAVTPAGNVRRYDARFFLVDAAHVSGELRGNGELLDLRWEPVETVGRLPLGAITALVLELLADRLSGPHDGAVGDRVPLYRELFGSELLEHH